MSMLRLPTHIRSEIASHLRSAIPHEGVGLLAVDRCLRDASSAGPVTARHFFAGTNVDASATRYTMDPAEVIAALRTIREHGWYLGGIVHSHLAGPATPSAVDLREAHYPDALMIIVSFATSPPEMRAWLVDEEGPPVEWAISPE
jgi:proteasome lid subunit RPN8/RPN11